MKRNIALTVEPPKLQQKERTYLSEEEVMLLIEAIDHRLIQIVVMIQGYASPLTQDTVDLNKRLIHVVADKGNKDRYVPISDKLLPILTSGKT